MALVLATALPATARYAAVGWALQAAYYEGGTTFTTAVHTHLLSAATRALRGRKVSLGVAGFRSRAAEALLFAPGAHRADPVLA